jgi:putative ABC transport system permease protein
VRLVLRWAEFVALAVRNLLGYPLRSLLTTLGVVFGIASVVTMLAMGRGAEDEIMRQIGQLGIRNVIVNSVKPPESSSGGSTRQRISEYGLKFKDREQIEATVPGLVRVLPVHSYVERVWHGSSREEVVVLGVTPDHFAAAQLEVAAGRGITEDDERERRPVCVVHLRLLRSIGHYGPPIGYQLLVGEQYYEVVGLLKDEEFTGYARKALTAPESRENEVYAPYSTVIARIGTMSISRRSGSFEASNVELNQVLVEVGHEDDVEPVARMVRAVLEQSHPDRDYEIVVPKELLAQKRRAQQVFTYMLVAIACISLLVGGIGIANIMLATVTERTHEIGVRRAIGAQRRHIVAQFLTETITLSAAGGLLGIVAGWGGVALLRELTPYAATVDPGALVAAVGISFVVGILSGIFPGWRASSLDPIQALRYE